MIFFNCILGFIKDWLIYVWINLDCVFNFCNEEEIFMFFCWVFVWMIGVVRVLIGIFFLVIMDVINNFVIILVFILYIFLLLFL